MKNFIFNTVLFFSLFSFGQSSNDKIIFIDSSGIETDSVNFVTKRVIENFNLKKEIYNVKEYDSQNILQVSKQVKDKNRLTLNGDYINFYPNGNIKKKLRFENYKKVGEVRSWYENGNLKFEGNYKINKENSELVINNFWDENRVQKVVNGEGVFVETEIETKKDTLNVIGSILNGKKEGVWKNLKEGYPIIEDVYNNGELISGKTTHSENETYTYKVININAEPTIGIQGFRKKLATSIKLPQVEKTTEIRTIVRFSVNKDGTLSNFKIISCTSPIMNDELIRVLMKEPKWNPTFFRGKAVKSSFTLPMHVNITESL